MMSDDFKINEAAIEVRRNVELNISLIKILYTGLNADRQSDYFTRTTYIFMLIPAISQQLRLFAFYDCLHFCRDTTVLLISLIS